MPLLAADGANPLYADLRSCSTSTIFAVGSSSQLSAWGSELLRLARATFARGESQELWAGNRPELVRIFREFHSQWPASPAVFWGHGFCLTPRVVTQVWNGLAYEVCDRQPTVVRQGRRVRLRFGSGGSRSILVDTGVLRWRGVDRETSDPNAGLLRQRALTATFDGRFLKETSYAESLSAIDRTWQDDPDVLRGIHQSLKGRVHGIQIDDTGSRRLLLNGKKRRPTDIVADSSGVYDVFLLVTWRVCRRGNEVLIDELTVATDHAGAIVYLVARHQPKKNWGGPANEDLNWYKAQVKWASVYGRDTKANN